MTTLKSIFNVLHEDVDLCSAEEIKSARKLIIAAQEMDSAEAETLMTETGRKIARANAEEHIIQRHSKTEFKS